MVHEKRVTFAMGSHIYSHFKTIRYDHRMHFTIEKKTNAPTKQDDITATHTKHDG